jgi:hypothetical protein
VRRGLDATKTGPNQGNEEAGTRVASAEMTSLHEELRRRLQTTEETTHAETTEEAVMTAVVEMEDTGVEDESRNKVAARCPMHQDHSMHKDRRRRRHRQARLQDPLHQSGSVARHATMLRLLTTGAVAEVATSEAEEAADGRMTGAEAEDLAVRKISCSRRH